MASTLGMWGTMTSWLGFKSGETKKVEVDPGRPDAEVAKDAQITTAAEEWTEDYDDKTLRDAYPKMLADPAVKAALFTKLMEVCALKLEVRPPEGSEDDEQAKEIATFVKYCLTRLSGGAASGLLMKIAKPALMYQYSVSEIVLSEIQHGKWAGKWGLKCLKSKDVTDDWSFTVDAFKNVQALVHTTVDGRMEYPVDKFLRYAFMPEFENPRGISDLRAAYRAWFVKRFVHRAWAVVLEKGGAVPVGRYGPGTDSRKALETQLAAFGARRWLAVPEDVKLEIVQFASDVMLKGYNDAVAVYDKQIMLSIRGAFLQALEGDRTGARSMGEVHESTADLFVWYLSYELADAINAQLVPLLVKLNFPDAEPPIMALEAPVDEDLKVKADTVKVLSDMGYPVSKKWITETFGVPAAEDEDDQVKKPEPPPSPFGPGGIAGLPLPVEKAKPGEPATEPEETEDHEMPEGMAHARNRDTTWLGAFLAEYDRARRSR